MFQGNLNKARSFYERVMVLDPNNALVRDNIRKLDRMQAIQNNHVP